MPAKKKPSKARIGVKVMGKGLGVLPLIQEGEKVEYHEESHEEQILRLAYQTEQHAYDRVKLARWQVGLAMITFLVVMFHLVYNILY